MFSKVRWIGENPKTVIVESYGTWDSLELLSHAPELINGAPRYIIWNPTHVIFLAENSVIDLENEAPERFKILTVVVSILRKDESAHFIIIRTNPNPVFEAIQKSYENNGITEQLVFFQQEQDALDFIDSLEKND